MPLAEMEKLLQNSPALPYDVQFSLRPYIDNISAKMCTACDNTKSVLLPVLEGNQKLFDEGKIKMDKITSDGRFQTLMSMAVPSLMYNSDLSYIAPPFTKSFIVKSREFESFLSDPDWEVELKPDDIDKRNQKMITQACICILNQLYGQNLPLRSGELFSVRNKRTKLVRHYRMNLKTDFVKVKAKGDIPKISQAQIDFLVQNPDDSDLWLKHLPPESYTFYGFIVGSLFDVTDIQVLSDFKQWLSYSDSEEPTGCIDELSYYVRSFLGADDVNAGIILLDEAMAQDNGSYSLSGENSLESLLSGPTDPKGIYDHMLTAERVLYIEDIEKLENPSTAELKLKKKGIRSFVLSPMKDENGQMTIFLELGSKIPGTFNNWTVEKLQEIFNQLKLSFEKFHHEINNQITSVIQKNFTSIHPSVSWKFDEVARDYYVRKQQGEEEVIMAPIVFNDIFPLYGQSDIVNSSTIRNSLVKEDLIENIMLLHNLLEDWSGKLRIHLLEAYQLKLGKLIGQLKDEFVSADESRIVSLITKEIHPLLQTTVERYPELKNKKYKAYLKRIDPQLGIVYNKRKDFEKSVNRLNAAIADYLEEQEQKMQSILPHFFEKYKTDGVEYNLYLGESILQNGQFVEDDLRNFKLWQLETTCEITRLVNSLSTELPVALKTAELIFVYNHSLSIKFRMDEKKFDVDGAYNVRYEILKKRIDKATIKGTDERLTIAGKVALVYLNEADRTEYLDFFEYLVDKGLIESNIEDLELNDVQGAEGLHALRVTVIK